MRPAITSTAVTFHLLPGMTPKVIEFAGEMAGDRKLKHEESRSRLGITAERMWTEPTNAGDVLVFYFEGPDIERSLMAIGESSELHDIWFREKIFALTGADLCDYRQIKAAELLFESPELRHEGPVESVATVFHVLPGMLDDWRAWLTELTVARRTEYEDYLARYGLTRERFFLRDASGEHTVVLYAEGQDPAGAISRFARSNHPFDVWIREELLQLSGIDFIRRGTAPAPHLVFAWTQGPRSMAA